MKKGVVFVSIAILVAGMLAFFSAAPKKTQAASTKDQSCANVNETYYMVIGNNPPEQQSFVPTQNRLTDVTLKLGGYNFNGDATIRILSGDTPIASKTITFATSTPTYRTFTFATPVTLTSGGTYKIWIDDSATASPLYWYTNIDPNCNLNGSAFWKGSAQIPDFDFATWGYTVSEPAAPSGDQPGNQGTTGTAGTTGTGTTGETLGTASASIAKPLELKAAYTETPSSGVKLDWKASTTTDIDGYKVFRSETADKGYTKVGDVKKEKIEYLDQDITASKTYYYQVRAYKGSTQSYSSNTASASVPADAAPAKPQKLIIVGTTVDSISVKWQANTEANLAGYAITLNKGETKVKSEELKKDATTYQFKAVEAGTSYTVELVAKNDKGKSSAAATVIAETMAKATIASFFTPLTISLIAAVLILTGVLVLLFIKRGRVKIIK